jgi:hypothetical protein
MTVAELIEELKNYPSSAMVRFWLRLPMVLVG